MNATKRQANQRRETKETTVAVALVVDGAGAAKVDTGIPFFDHMLEQLGKHAGFDLVIDAEGDLTVDLHHTVEDVGIVLGGTLREALADKRGVRRFANALVPLDEALVQIAVDLSGRNGHHVIEASFKGVAQSLRDAVRVEGADVPSTKGVL